MRSSIGYCSSCNARIFWARTSNDKSIPLDLASVPKEDHGKLALRYSAVAGHVVHFTTCTKPAQRKRGA
jgi:hypothetical protein